MPSGARIEHIPAGTYVLWLVMSGEWTAHDVVTLGIPDDRWRGKRYDGIREESRRWSDEGYPWLLWGPVKVPNPPPELP